jgi:hypothetical protein
MLVSELEASTGLLNLKQQDEQVGLLCAEPVHGHAHQDISVPVLDKLPGFVQLWPVNLPPFVDLQENLDHSIAALFTRQPDPLLLVFVAVLVARGLLG